MLASTRRILLPFLRVPPQPATPPGEVEVRVFRAAPRYYAWRIFWWAVAQAGTLALLLGVGLFNALGSGSGGRVAGVASLSLGALIIWAIQFGVTFLLLRFDYELRWYILTDRSLRIREGVLRIAEKTMTFANIQQITVTQGPIQRFLGIADVVVRSAGGGAQGSSQPGLGAATDSAHLAHFRGVNNADEIRTLIQERVRLHRDSGLGDPDDHLTAAPVSPPPVTPTSTLPAADLATLTAAARALTAEARALNTELDSRAV